MKTLKWPIFLCKRGRVNWPSAQALLGTLLGNKVKYTCINTASAIIFFASIYYIKVWEFHYNIMKIQLTDLMRLLLSFDKKWGLPFDVCSLGSGYWIFSVYTCVYWEYLLIFFLERSQVINVKLNQIDIREFGVNYPTYEELTLIMDMLLCSGPHK